MPSGTVFIRKNIGYRLSELCTILFMNRTMKSNVTAELTIPQQTRYLVPIELGRVERHVNSYIRLVCQLTEQIIIGL